MRAAILTQYGEPPEVGDFDEPEAGDGQAVVEILAGGLNPVDLMMAQGTHPRGRPPLPSVAGREGIGRTEDGDVLYFSASVAPYGSFAPRSLIDPGTAFPVPEGVDPALAVSFGIAGLAAWLGLEWRAALQPGETVLVLGASGTVGHVAVQAARLLGAGRVVAAARSADSLEAATRVGADATVALSEHEGHDALVQAFRDAGERGVDVVIDPVWGAPASAALGAANEGARLVQIGQSASPQATFASTDVRNNLAAILGHTNFAAPLDRQRDAYRRMVEHAAQGELEVEVERVALEDAPDAWRRQAESPRRKLVVVPGEG